MNKEENNGLEVKGISTTIKSLAKSCVTPVIIMVSIVAVSIGAMYVINKKTFDEGVEQVSKTYTANARLDSQNGIVIERVNENGETVSQGANSIEGMSSIFEEIYGADNYLKDDKESTKEEKLQYLMNAELVTKFPYVSSIDGDESKLNGVVKFYRYTNQISDEETVDEVIVDINPNEIFYIGDTWITRLQEYMQKEVSPYEYPGDNNFVCSDNLNILKGDLEKEELKKKIDKAGSNITSIVLMLGINNRSAEAATKASELIQYLASTYTDKIIYVLKMPHVGVKYKSEIINMGSVQLNNEIDQYNSTILTTCSEITNAKLIDTTSNMVTENFYLDEQYTISDENEEGINLTEYGYQVWYTNILECISKGKSSVDMSMYLMTYINEADFEAMYEQYKQGGSKEIFKYFTLNEDRDIVIASWSQNSIQISSDDPEITIDSLTESYKDASFNFSQNEDGSFSSGKFKITKKSLINYDKLINKYSMPFSLLWGFLVQTGSYDFAKEMADLAYTTEIKVGIYDNQTISYRTTNETYSKSIRYAENTELNFIQFNGTSEYPAFNITNTKYSNVVRACYATLNDGKSVHTISTDSGLLGQINEDTVKYAYITEMSEGGTITGVSKIEKMFTTITNVTNINSLTPAVGIIVADNWIARWEAEYLVQEDTKSNSSSGASDPEEYGSIDRYKISESVLYGINPIGNDLTSHSNKIKQNAINQIVETTSYSLSSLDITDIQKHLNSCTTCQNEIKTIYGKDLEKIKSSGKFYQVAKEIVDDKNYSGEDKNSLARKKIYEHASASKTATRKVNFINKLNNEITCTQYATAEQAKTNITSTSYSTRIKYTYEKDTTTIENEAEKFKEIINDKEYINEKQTFRKNGAWFWEYIQSTEETAELEDILRIMFNIAFDTDIFGTYTEEQINSIFKVFEPKLKMKAATGSGMKLCKEYIRSWEGATMLAYINDEIPYSSSLAKYISEDKQFYYVADDGVGNPTVGFGIDIFNGGFVGRIMEETGYTSAQLRNIKGQVAISAEFIDSLEDEVLQNARNYIKEKTAELDLKSYQIYALVSRSYNCGHDGAVIGYGGYTFVEAYNEFFDPEEDDWYGEMLGDFNHGLYVNFMSTPVKANTGEYLLGLERRRKSEWTLFQTGYMDILDKWCSPGGDIIELCVEVMEELMEYNVQYTLTDLVWNNIELSNDYSTYGVCCATYVATVIYRAELMDAEFMNSYNYNVASVIGDMCEAAGWIRIDDPDDAEPGDVCGWWEHAFIYAGGNEIYDQASGCISEKGAPPVGGTRSKWNEYKEKDGLFIYRAP